MRKIIGFFVDRSFLVNMVSVFIILFGAFSFFQLKRDLIPALQFNIVTVESTIPGASALEMEKYVTFPIEEAVHGLPGTLELTSDSQNNSSVVTVKFEVSKENIDETVEVIKSRVNQIRHKLPEKISEINVKQQKIDSFQFLHVTISGADQVSDSDRAFIDLVKTKIQQIAGIVKVKTNLPDRHLYVEFDENKLSKSGYDINYARTKLKEYFSYTPIGTIHQDETTISFDLKTNINSIEDIKNLPLFGNTSGKFTSLKDVASVEFRNENKDESFLLNDKSSIDLIIYKDTDSDAIDLREDVSSILSKVETKLPSHLTMRITADSPAFIEKQLNVLQSNALTGVFLVCLILYFLLGPRIALMTAMGMPLAYFGTFLVLSNLGISFDLISLIGMIIVVGMLVDDAIIVSESYTQLLEKGLEPREAAIEAAASMILPVTGTILTTIVAFAPILIIQSEMGKILYAIPVVIISALVISWFESFFVLPNHLRHFAGKISISNKETRFDRIKSAYEKLLIKGLKFRYLVVVGLFVFFIGSLVIAAIMPKKFDLKIAQNKIQITSALKESESLSNTERRIIPLIQHINDQDFENIDYVSTTVGTTWIDDKQKTGYRYATVNVYIDQHISRPEEAHEILADKIEHLVNEWKTDEYELLKSEVKTTDNKNIDDNQISIYVSGGDKLSFETLQDEINGVASKVDNITKLDVDTNQFQTSWQFFVNKIELVRYGFSTHQIAEQISEFFSSQELITYRYNGESIKLYTQYKEISNIELNQLNNLKLVSNRSQLVPISYLGEWKKVNILKSIKHEDLHRKFKLDVTYDGNSTNRDNIIQNLDKEMDFLRNKYPAYQFVVENLSDDEKRSRSYALKVGLLTGGLVLLVLSLVLGSLTQPLLVSLAIPFGFSGIVYAVWLHGYEVDLMMFIGLIGMAGVVVNDSLIMIDSINQNMKTMQDTHKAIVNGASSRLRSIILTTLTTLGGLFPMAYGIGGESGFTAPLAFAMGWGMLSATILTLFVLPALLFVRIDIVNFLTRIKALVFRTS